MIFTLGEQGIIKYISPNCLNVFGYVQSELEGAAVYPLISPEDIDVFKAATEKAFSSGGGKPLELRLVHKDGSFHWYGLRFSKLEEDGETALICNSRNIDENIKYEEKLKFLSLHDQLTGAANRALFNQEMEDTERVKYPVSVLLCDIDRLKAVNDRYGHATGDRIITATSNLIRSALRKEDLLARVGGDEFAVLLKGTSRKEALKAIERISEAFSKYNSGGAEIKLGISIGLATAQSPSCSLQKLVHKADKDMYSQKSRKGI